MKASLAIFFSLSICLSTSLFGDTIFVDTDATGTNDGSSWTDAYLHLQDALDEASIRDDIWVAVGSYFPDKGANQTEGDRSSTFQLKREVAIYGGFTGTETLLAERDFVANESVLSGDLSQDDGLEFANNSENTYHVVTGSGTNFTAILDGFIISGGNANGSNSLIYDGGGLYNDEGAPSIANCIFLSNFADQDGGAIYNMDSSPSLTNCTFLANSANLGGAVYNISSSPTLTNCTFQNNSTFGTFGEGGAINNFSSSPTLTNCSFLNNHASDDGGAIANLSSSTTILRDCLFVDNSSDNTGGAIRNSSSSPSFTNCTFQDNSANRSGGAVGTLSDSVPVFTNCLFQGNFASNDGGAFWGRDDSSTFTNCSFQGNSAEEGGAIYKDSGSVTFTNCIIWTNFEDGNSTPQGASLFNFQEASVTYQNCLIDNFSKTELDDSSPDSVANLEPSDPLFLSSSDLRLQSGSPAINAGHSLANSEPFDLAGNPRLVPIAIDLGPYESSLISFPNNIPRVHIPTPPGGQATVPFGAPATSPFNSGAGFTFNFSSPSGSLTFNSLPTVDSDGTLRFSVPPGSSGSATFQVTVTVPSQTLPDFTPVTLSIELGARIHVSASATGNNDGTSWNDAFLSLQDALASASPLDHIWVAHGTYYPDEGTGLTNTDTGRFSTFQLQNKVPLYGAFAGNETFLSERVFDSNETILSGDLTQNDGPDFANNGENSFHVLTGSGTGSTDILDGFTITGGNANGRLFPSYSGGGLFNSEGSPTISNCLFRDNFASNDGGAVYNNNSSPFFSKCSFQNNSSASHAGAVYNFNSTMTLTKCSFQINSAFFRGGAVYSLSGSISLLDCSFEDNSANFGSGGGFYNRNTRAILTNCSFQGNSCLVEGGAIYDFNGFSTYTNCKFQNNSSLEVGGAVFNQSSIRLENCSFQGNSASVDGGAVYGESGTTRFYNCILWDNSANGERFSASASIFSSSTPVYSHSLIENYSKTDLDSSDSRSNTNLEPIDPLFVSAQDLRLQAHSPVIHGGNRLTNSSTVDLDGNPRVTPFGDIDLGAYEFQQAAPILAPIYIPESSGSEESLALWAPDSVSYNEGAGFVYDFSLQAGTLNFDSLPSVDPDGTIRYTLTPGGTGSATFQVVAIDPSGSFSNIEPTSFTIFVTPTLFVDTNADGNGDGTSWVDALPFLQDALAFASDGIEIWVAGGTYYPDEGSGQNNGDRFSTFQLPPGVNIYGGFRGIETLPVERNANNNPSILSGDLSQNDSPNFSNNEENSYNVLSSTEDGTVAVFDGFTVAAGNANLRFSNQGRGGGLLLSSGSPSFLNCSFQDNFSSGLGGAVYISTNSSPTFIGCAFLNNSAQNGGAISTVLSSPSLFNCSFNGNSAFLSGGAFYNGSSFYNESSFSPILVNCSFLKNSASREGGAIANLSSNPDFLNLVNCIIWNNSAGGSTVSTDASVSNLGFRTITSYSYSLVANSGGSSSWRSTLGVDNGNNLDLNPLFINDSDLRLQSGSPALDVGDNSINNQSLDLEGNPRIQNTLIDLGAYEGSIDATFNLLHPTLLKTNDDNNNGHSNYTEYALGGDPTASHDPSLQPSLIGNELTFSFRNNAADVFVEFQKSDTLLPDDWEEMILGTDYTLSSENINDSTTTQTLNLLTSETTFFFRELFTESAP